MKIQFRRDTAASWSSNNPILLEGEIGLDTTNDHFKIGDGTTNWNTLLYSYGDWNTIVNKPSTFTPSSHTHTISDTTGLQSALDAKTTESYVDAQITNVVGAAPDALNTLQELGDALGDDANFAGSMTTALAGKVDDSQVLTNVPSGAVFTDTTYSVGDGGLTQKNFTTTLKNKLDGIATSANNYVHPTGAGNLHVPTAGTVGQVLTNTASGTGTWQDAAAGGIGSFIDTSIAISSNGTALANDDGTANRNIGIGTNALNAITTNIRSLAIGDYAGSETTGGYNTLIGEQCGFYMTTGTHNTAVGQETLMGDTTSKLTGSYNTGIGYQTGRLLTTGQYNVLNGYQAGYSLTSGSNNVFFGVSAGKGQTGSSNIAIGENSMLCAAGGSQSYNIALGRLTGAALTTGTNNTILGQKAGQNLTSGYNNVLIGENAGNDLTTHFNNVLIGNDAGATLLDSNKLHIANNATESLIEGDFSAKTLTINGALTATGNITAYSDERIKENIQEIPNALDAVDAIRGVSYTRTDTKEDSVGVIAQEVEALFPELISEHKDGIKSVNYNGLIGVLFSAVKELSTKVKELESQIKL